MNIGRRRNKKTPKKYVCEEDSEEEEKSCLDDTIYGSGNKVYFYEDIYGESILKLKKVIEKIAIELGEIKTKYHTDPHIELFF